MKKAAKSIAIMKATKMGQAVNKKIVINAKSGTYELEVPDNAIMIEKDNCVIYFYSDDDAIIPCDYLLVIKKGKINDNQYDKFRLVRINKKTGASAIILSDNDFEQFVKNLNFHDVCLLDKAYGYDIERIVDEGKIRKVFTRFYSIHSKATFRIVLCIEENNVLKSMKIYPLAR